MKKESKIIQRIESCYVGEDCVQIMVPYQKAITIFDDKGILYHSKKGSSTYNNKYLEDERRTQFPYSNIPVHYSKIGLFGKICYANQLFDFEKPYIRICDNSIIESFAVKDNNEALMINNVLSSYKRTGYRTREELAKLFEKNDENEEIYFIDLSGAIVETEAKIDKIIPTEEKITKVIKKSLEENVHDFREYQKEHGGDTVGYYLYKNPYFLDFVEQSIEQFDLSKYKVDAPLGSSLDSTIIVRIKDGNITLQNIQVNFIGVDNYKVIINDIPVNKYTLEQLKFVPGICITKEPRIPLKLNPGITKQDIEEAKQMVKSLRK